MKSQLLATFTTKDNLDNTIKNITNVYTIIFNKIYVLQNENNVNEFMVPWEIFKNMLMVTNSDGLNRINTRIFKIININEKKA